MAKMAVSKPKAVGLVALSIAATRGVLTKAFLGPSVALFSVPNKGTSSHSPIHEKSSGISPTLYMTPEYPHGEGKSNDREPHAKSSSSHGSQPGDSEPDVPKHYQTDQYSNDGEFPLPEDTEVSLTRQLRWEREALVQSQFAAGDEVIELRRKVADLRGQLVDARVDLEDFSKTGSNIDILAAKNQVKELETEILELNSRDAEFVYAVAMERLKDAEHTGDSEEVKRIQREASEARICIPHYNLHGLWVGKYGTQGYEMINVTYSGDTLIATKVTGDKNVPKGEVSFTADLSPQFGTHLESIELNERAARQWGKKYLPRHPGKGQVATEGYQNAQWLEGQLIMVGRFFSFAWVPIGHQVFFGRPSADLTIKMIKEKQQEDLKKDHVAVMRDALEKCWDESYWEEKETNRYITEEGCFE